jgi:site-specific DNA-cytosine methylase
MVTDKVIQICNVAHEGGFKNPQRGRVYSTEGISPCVNGLGTGGGKELKIMEGKRDANTLLVREANKNGYTECEAGGCFSANYMESKTRRGRVIENGNISPTVTRKSTDSTNVYEGKESPPQGEETAPAWTLYRIRKLTPLETARLMGVMDEDTRKMQEAGISKSAMYRLHGNSIVVDVLYYIFQSLLFPEDLEKKDTQLSLF